MYGHPAMSVERRGAARIVRCNTRDITKTLSENLLLRGVANLHKSVLLVSLSIKKYVVNDIEGIAFDIERICAHDE